MFIPLAQRASHLPQHTQLPTHPSLPTAREGTRISESSLRLPQGLDCSWFIPQIGEWSKGEECKSLRGALSPHQPFPFCFAEGKEECQGAFPSLLDFFPSCAMQHRLNWRQRKHLELNPLLSTPCQPTRIHYLLSYASISHTSKPAASSPVPLHSPNNLPISTTCEPRGHNTPHPHREREAPIVFC